MTNYTLNVAAARSVGQSGYLKEPGKYIGAFTRAEKITSTKGTQGIEFSFKSNDGQEADYLTLWTHNTDGKELYGYKVVMAIMACLRLREIKPAQGIVEKQSRTTMQKEKISTMVFPDLMHKPIGLVLQGEEFQREDLTTGVKLNIFVPFDASSELTAGEILDKKTDPQALPRIIQQLEREPVRKLKPQAAHAAPRTASPLDQMDDDQDIPF